MMRNLLYIVLGIIIVLVLIFLFQPAPIAPEAWTPRPGIRLEGVLAGNTRLQQVEELAKGMLSGPEEIAMDHDGVLYTGTRDGRIVRLKPGSEPETIAATRGRPLGMKFDHDGNLIVCDAFKGLLSVSQKGQIKTLAASAEGIPIKFANALDISKDNVVYFTDASFRYGPDESRYELLESKPYGRLLAFDPETGDVTVLMHRLYFANGVALSSDEDFILINETYRYRILRYWLKGPRSGTSDTFIDRLPGFPDNISGDGRGGFWLALWTVRDDFLDRLHPYPFIKAQFSKLPGIMWPAPRAYGLVLSLDGTGKIIQGLHDPSGIKVKAVTSVREYDGFLYLGSLDRDSIARLPVR